jgi:DNA-binding MarR family transcriptional regulator
VIHLTQFRLRNPCEYATILRMEAATKPAKRAAGSGADREIALRLGSLILHLMNSSGGSAFRPIDEAGLTLVQTKALLILASPEHTTPCSVKLVAESLDVSLASATRDEDPEDRRMKRIALTAKGRGIADEVMAARLEGIERFAASLSPEERRKLEAALEVLLKREEIATTYEAHRRRERSR